MYHIVTPYLDADGLALLVDAWRDAVTTEFENVPAACAAPAGHSPAGGTGRPTRWPCARTGRPKRPISAPAACPVRPFAVIDTRADLAGRATTCCPAS
jgi:phosphoribosylaminoimidazole carboxylase (NCAIR synthetase)